MNHTAAASTSNRTASSAVTTAAPSIISSAKRLAILLALLLATPVAFAQNNNADQNVTIVDDEDCGCELYYINGIQTTQSDNLFGFKRDDGTVIVEPKYMYVDQFHGDYCIVYSSPTSCGIINRDGIEVVPPTYEDVAYPSDGMIRVRSNGLYGFFDTLGNEVIKPHYRTASGFSEDLATVIIDFDSITCAYGFINKADSLVLPAIYEYAFTFQEGYAVVKLYDRYGVIDKKGRTVLPCKYLEVTPMIDGRFFAVDALSELAAMFDNHFRPLTKFCYQQITNYSDGIFVVRRDGAYTFLDVKGKERFGFYDEVSGFVDGYSMVSRDGKYGIINSRGKAILPIKYDNSGYRSMQYIFSEDLALIEEKGRYGFVNKRGQIVIPTIYESAYQCTEGLIPVQLHGVWGYIDKQNNIVCDFQFMAASPFQYGRAEIVYNSKVFKISPQGKCLKNCKQFPSEIRFNLK